MSNIGAGERQAYQNQVRGKYRKIDNANAALAVSDQVVIVASDSSAVTVTLPQVDEAAGRIYSIQAPDGGDNTVTVQDNDESMNWSDLSLDFAADRVLLYSDGLSWWTLQLVEGA